MTAVLQESGQRLLKTVLRLHGIYAVSGSFDSETAENRIGRSAERNQVRAALKRQDVGFRRQNARQLRIQQPGFTAERLPRIIRKIFRKKITDTVQGIQTGFRRQWSAFRNMDVDDRVAVFQFQFPFRFFKNSRFFPDKTVRADRIAFPPRCCSSFRRRVLPADHPAVLRR